jgi:hypothetical protein
MENKEPKLLKITPRVYEYFRTKVKGNEDATYDLTTRKLNRNIQLAKEFMPDLISKHLGTTTYRYGNLHIKTRFNKIINIKNHYGTGSHWNVDEKRIHTLNVKYGII